MWVQSNALTAYIWWIQNGRKNVEFVIICRYRSKLMVIYDDTIANPAIISCLLTNYITTLLCIEFFNGLHYRPCQMLLYYFVLSSMILVSNWTQICIAIFTFIHTNTQNTHTHSLIRIIMQYFRWTSFSFFNKTTKS